MDRIRPIERAAMSLLIVLLATPFAAPPARAQIPEKFTNLKVFPKETTKEDLTAAMRSFSTSLGVRCGHCHVREEGNGRGDFDWASDAKPEKTTARVMLEMTRFINATELPKITTQEHEKVEVRCRTCHHGQARPFLIEDLLSAAYKAGGLDSLETRYEGLRKEYYGADTYNFGVDMLPALGEKLGVSPQDALKLAEYNAQVFPGSGRAHLALGQALAKAGETEPAIVEVKRAAEIEPALREDVERMLSRLQKK